jgi:large subunit ribosomal protein L6
MSRVGRKPVPIPETVKVSVKGRIIVVEGPLGKLEGVVPEGVTVSVADRVATVAAPPPNRSNRGYQGLMRALLANMVHGVTQGYERGLEISGVGYKAELNGRTLTFSLGYTHQIDLVLPDGIEAVVDKQQTKVSIKGIDRQLVGQIAAQIHNYKNPEPYKGKGVKYAGETIRRKVGKAGAK